MNTLNPEDLANNAISLQESAETVKSVNEKEVVEPIEVEKEIEDVVKSEYTVEMSEVEADNATISDEVDIEEGIESSDYALLTREQLVETLAILVDESDPQEIKVDVDRIKSLFYKQLKAENEERRQKYLSEGGNIEDYKPQSDSLEIRFKEILNGYRSKKAELNKVQDIEKIANLKDKYEIIEKIKELVNKEEAINKTFQEFRALQTEWRNIGQVPQSALKELWENYNHNVEIFYDYIKINNELKDLDLKKNLEAKIAICEKAESLLQETDIIKACRQLQEYHQQWREIGPVPTDKKEETWERFKAVSSAINRNQHDFFDKRKEEQKKNLDIKQSLCEAVESINALELKSFKEFDEKAAEIVELQQQWRKTGYTPKKQNTKIYQRFHDACDIFFEKKRLFYNENKEIQQGNIRKKIELCEKAESVQDSTDWKEITNVLIQLQKEWKEIGTTPKKQADKLWKRFRTACDKFFDNKAAHFSKVDSGYFDNLKAKEDIIEAIENLDIESETNPATSFEKINQLEQQWSEIGFVPLKKKEDINNRYKKALNAKLDALKDKGVDISVMKYQSRLDNMQASTKVSKKIKTEREKFFAKIKQLENDIVVWENNIGFFAKSKNADILVRDFEEKIAEAKKNLKALEEKVRIIDRSGLDE